MLSVQHGEKQKWTVKALSYILRASKDIADGSAVRSLLSGLVLAGGKGSLEVKVDCRGELHADSASAST